MFLEYGSTWILALRTKNRLRTLAWVVWGVSSLHGLEWSGTFLYQQIVYLKVLNIYVFNKNHVIKTPTVSVDELQKGYTAGEYNSKFEKKTDVNFFKFNPQSIIDYALEDKSINDLLVRVSSNLSVTKKELFEDILKSLFDDAYPDDNDISWINNSSSEIEKRKQMYKFKNVADYFFCRMNQQSKTKEKY